LIRSVVTLQQIYTQIFGIVMILCDFRCAPKCSKRMFREFFVLVRYHRSTIKALRETIDHSCSRLRYSGGTCSVSHTLLPVKKN
jgi:hypothetical protein